MSIASRARGAWSQLTKAAVDEPSTTSLATRAQIVASGLQGISSSSTPPQVVQAMVEQGMLQGGPLSPGQPIQQWTPQGTSPREWDFQTGYNIGARPRANEGRVSFQTLSEIIKNWDVARTCIEHIQDDIRSLDWHIVSTEDAAEDDVSADIKAARQFMEKPDGVTPFDSWQQKFLEDVLRFDAGTLFKQRNRAGKVIALEVVQGPTIAPLLDDRGGVPRAPAPAYVQFVQGIPYVWLNADDVIYQPFRPQPESPYGLPPLEWLLLTANIDMRFQWHFLNYFTEGTLPDAFMESPPDTSDPEAVKRLQTAWDAIMEGDQAQKHKIRWIPAGAHPTFTADKAFDSNFPLYLMRKCAAAYKVTPNDLGFTDDVNRATADTQVDVQFRVGTQPRLRHLQGIYNRFLQDDLGLRVKFEYDTGGEKEDRLQEAQLHQVYVNMGAESPDEVRRDVLGLPIDTDHPTPRFIFSARAGAIPLKSLDEVAGEIDPETAGPVDVQQLSTVGFVQAAGVISQPGDSSTSHGQVGDQLIAQAKQEQMEADQQLMEQMGDTSASSDGSDDDTDDSSSDDASGSSGASSASSGAAGAAAAPSEPAAGGVGAAPVQKAGEVQKELGRWRENARRRVKQGKAPRPFRSDILTSAQHAMVWDELQKAVSILEVDRAFHDPGQAARLRVAQNLQDAIAAELARRS